MQNGSYIQKSKTLLRLCPSLKYISMKKCLYVLVLFAVFFSCNRHVYFSDEPCYRVYKIRLNNEYYEIYAERNGQHYKIVSKKEEPETGIRIRRGGCYLFELTSMRESPPTINGVNLIPVNYLDVQYVHPNNSPIKIDGGKITDLYYAKNLRGLYLVEPVVHPK